MQGKKQLKVAVLIRRFVTTGGAERYAFEVTKRLAENHEVHVFAQHWSRNIPSTIRMHKIPFFFKKPSFLNQLTFSRWTNRGVDRSFDIIHSHERVTRFDVLTVHCPCYRGFMNENRGPWKNLGMQLSVATSPRHLSYLWLEKQQFAYKKDRLFIAVSQNVKNDVQANYPLPDISFRLAYPGVDSSHFHNRGISEKRRQYRSALGLSSQHIAILFVGTEFKRKGLDALFRGYARLKHENTRLLVAGGGDTAPYRRLAARLDIRNRVTFLGLVQDMATLYAAADLYVLPTLSDPCPMAPIEAMASGLATIMSRAEFCGSAEHIRNKEALILKDPTDDTEITHHLTMLMDEKTRRAVGERGRRLAETLSWEKTTAETLRAYYDVVSFKHFLYR
ncbi:MAG: glycosyltransferase family 4 protein [Deltaproteobacteria bacterium]|nr:glycosyltransferase family 4 protein [Deltaproteobacteria bacterium]